jgi:hypothetical protein
MSVIKGKFGGGESGGGGDGRREGLTLLDPKDLEEDELLARSFTRGKSEEEIAQMVTDRLFGVRGMTDVAIIETITTRAIINTYVFTYLACIQVARERGLVVGLEGSRGTGPTARLLPFERKDDKK